VNGRGCTGGRVNRSEKPAGRMGDTSMAGRGMRGTRPGMSCRLHASHVSVERLEAARVVGSALMLEGKELGSNEEDAQRRSKDPENNPLRHDRLPSWRLFRMHADGFLGL
jgi:hypothetical protein